MGLGVRVIEAVDITEENQQIRLAQSRHNSGQRVIIAQDLVVPRLNLGGGDGVVLIYHRDDPHGEQR